ncbi:MAG TPA: hypothetical protein VN731_10130 [Rhodanobacter sp.]|nr:hypothetical protein [Rhodanobacter sp.]
MDATETVGTWIGLSFATLSLAVLIGMVAYDEIAGWLRKRRERKAPHVHYHVSTPRSTRTED